jgi:outer membrane protein OmpA-like peptidoglycan-associated protein
LKAIPVPVTFEFDKTTFTSAGERAAQEPARFLREQNALSLVLIGHADQRRPHEYNVSLSTWRVEAVAKSMQTSGVGIEIRAVAMGASEPVTVPEPSQYIPEELHALNRCVVRRRQ